MDSAFMNLSRMLREIGVRYATHSTVAAGPFKGMRYVGGSVGSVLAPKLLGTYELELHPAIQALIKSHPPMIIDVGAAEGYYAVGLARAIPSARVIAFEAQAKGRGLLRRMAMLNGVSDHVDLHGFCEVSSLSDVLDTAPAAAIIMDVEGAEEVLLDPEKIPALKHSSIVVEIHDRVSPTLGDKLLHRFEATHNVEIIHQRDRTSTDVPHHLQKFPASFMGKCMREYRVQRMRWFFFQPRG